MLFTLKTAYNIARHNDCYKLHSKLSLGRKIVDRLLGVFEFASISHYSLHFYLASVGELMDLCYSSAIGYERRESRMLIKHLD